MTSTDLQFDRMDIDTELAKEYLESNNYEFHGLGYEESGDHVLFEQCQIFQSTLNMIKPYENNSDMAICGVTYSENIHKLRNQIHKNIPLICQLEYLIRQKPLLTTKLDLDMILKKLLYLASDLTPIVNNYTKTLLMTDDSPLIDFGCIVMAPWLNIVATKSTAILCHLLTKICHDCGIDTVRLAIVAETDNVEGSFIKNKVLTIGGIGVVTASSDIDSAVSKLLSAPKEGIWGIGRILVQESAIERFKKSIAWKSKANGESDIDNKVKSLCTDVYLYDNKIYLYEYVGNQSNLQNVVFIEVFRTVKELISFVECITPFCVSLWSSYVAESNEIALGISAPIVWVNDYGVLGESALISQAYFSQISSDPVRNLELDPAFPEVCKLQKDWAKLSVSQRRTKIMDALKDLGACSTKTVFQNIASNPNNNNICHIATDYVVIGINKPKNIYKVQWDIRQIVVKDFVERLLNGCGFIVSYSMANSRWCPGNNVNNTNSIETSVTTVDKSVISALSRSDFPIRATYSEHDFQSYPLPDTTRVVHTSFGTIFAN